MKHLKKIAAMLLSLVFTVSCATSVFAYDYEPNETVNVHGAAAILYNQDTDTIVYQKNVDEKIDPSSLVKIMTAGLVMDYGTADILTEKITISQSSMDYYNEHFSGSICSGFDVGDTVSVKGLLIALMVSSSNDAAVILADYISDQYLDGTMTTFIGVMNEKANELGCSGTYFTNCTGIHDDNQFSTASDLLKITQYMLSYEPMSEICSYDSFKVTYRPADSTEDDTKTFVNTNAMMLTYSDNYYSLAGSVRGASTVAGTMHQISTAEYEGMHYILVMLDAPTEDADGYEEDYVFQDSIDLYRWALTTYSVKEVVTENDLIDGVEVPVKLSLNVKHTILVPENDVFLLVANDVSADDFKKVLHIDGDVLAPLSKNEEVGTMDLVLDGEVMATVPLRCTEDIERSSLLYVFYLIGKFFSNPFVKIILICMILFVVGYIFYTIQLNSAAEQKKRNEELKKKRRNRE